MEDYDKLENFLESEINSSLDSAKHFEVSGSSKSEDYEQRANNFKKILEIILSLKSKDSAEISKSVYISPSDIEGLPVELIAQLNITDTDRQDFQIIETINDAGGMASIDKILIGYYHKTKEIFERQKLMSKLYRMSVKGTIFAHPNKKGVYCTKPVKKDEKKKEIVDEE